MEEEYMCFSMLVMIPMGSYNSTAWLVYPSADNYRLSIFKLTRP